MTGWFHLQELANHHWLAWMRVTNLTNCQDAAVMCRWMPRKKTAHCSSTSTPKVSILGPPRIETRPLRPSPHHDHPFCVPVQMLHRRRLWQADQEGKGPPSGRRIGVCPLAGGLGESQRVWKTHPVTVAMQIFRHTNSCVVFL